MTSPYSLTTREIRGLTGMTSYNTSAKLSKLAADGVIDWRVKPRSVAEPETVSESELIRNKQIVLDDRSRQGRV